MATLTQPVHSPQQLSQIEKSSREKSTKDDAVIAHRRRRHLRVYTVNTSVCPDQGTPLLRRHPPRQKPNPSFSHRACHTVLGGNEATGDRITPL